MASEREKVTTTLRLDKENKEKAKVALDGAMDLNTYINLCVAFIADHEGALKVGEMLGNLKKK